MQLGLTRRALQDIDRIAQRAPRQALRVITAIEGLAETPFPGMHRQVEGRPGQHVMSVPPYHAVFYKLTARGIAVQQVTDMRRRRRPW